MNRIDNRTEVKSIELTLDPVLTTTSKTRQDLIAKLRRCGLQEKKDSTEKENTWLLKVQMKRRLDEMRLETNPRGSTPWIHQARHTCLDSNDRGVLRSLD